MDSEIFSAGVHHGNNVKRLRDILGIKQETMAQQLGLSQQTVSKLEQKEQIDDETLKKIAKVLNIPIEAIKNFNDEATKTYIINTFNNHDAVTSYFGYKCTFNPMDKIVELYERLLETERRKNE